MLRNRLVQAAAVAALAIVALVVPAVAAQSGADTRHVTATTAWE